MCHCKRSIKIHVKICERSVRNLVKIWNALSLSISCNWQVSLTYLMLNYYFMNSSYWIWIFLLLLFGCILYIVYYALQKYTLYNKLYSIYNIYSILYIMHNILYIIYWIQIQWISIVFLFNSNVLFKYNE
jgi:hypothetical protein